MEITVGQWCRDNKNRIAKILSDNLYGKGTFKHRKFKMSNGILITYADKITKTASTPQELIEVGDLTETMGEEISYEKIYNPKYFGVVESVDEIQICCSGGVILSHEDIIAIYTPNEDKTIYTEQWRLNNESI